MALIDYIDAANRRIYLSSETVDASIHPIDIYTEMRTLRRTDETLRAYDVFLKAYGNVPKGSGKYTEKYVVCQLGTKIVPYDTAHALTITGTIITDDGYEGVHCFDRSLLSSDVTVDINYVPPQVEVITINTGSGLTTEEHDRLMDLDTSGIGNIPADVWAYTVRELTVEAGLTQEQADILMKAASKSDVYGANLL